MQAVLHYGDAEQAALYMVKEHWDAACGIAAAHLTTRQAFLGPTHRGGKESAARRLVWKWAGRQMLFQISGEQRK